jgi:hypothetical protein
MLSVTLQRFDSANKAFDGRRDWVSPRVRVTSGHQPGSGYTDDPVNHQFSLLGPAKDHHVTDVDGGQSQMTDKEQVARLEQRRHARASVDEATCQPLLFGPSGNDLRLNQGTAH